MFIEALTTPFNILIIAALLFNLSQRSHLAYGEKKRYASLYIAGAILLFRAELALLERSGSPDLMLLPALLPPLLMLYLLRREVFIFRRRCRSCGARLPLKDVLYRDDPLCPACRRESGGLTEARSGGNHGHGSSGGSGGPEADEDMHTAPAEGAGGSVPATVEEVDWQRWQPQETAVLCYVFDRDQVLLINKKTGLGQGKVNAPGGRIEASESPEQAVVRELEEEVLITPTNFYRAGELSFIFTDGYSLHGHVYFAQGYRGQPAATAEADPFWVKVEEIPYGNMWEDDELWLPLALEGSFVTCRFIFDGDRMLSKQIETAPRGSAG
jgi:8-oxo-dGTP diphosphatase